MNSCLSKSISLVITYLNRKNQLRNTLRSIEQYDHDIEIIIIDDGSTDGEDINCFKNDQIKIITMKNKTWINPCIPFNVGFKEAKGDVIIFQCAECIHIGNIVGNVLSNISENTYLNYSTLSIDKTLTQRIFNGEDTYNVVSPHLNDYINANGGTGWYNHPKYRPEMLHFCSAIMKKDLYKLGGFDERYSDGLGYDDYDLIHRIRKMKMNIKIIENPFVVHQHHAPFNPGDVRTLMEINKPKYDRTISSDQYDVKPYNKIFK